MDMSYRLGWIDDSLVKRVDKILKQANLPTAPPDTMTVDMFKSIMAVRNVHKIFLFFINMFKSLILDSY